MNLTVNRETLHQAIEHLPENILPELAQFIIAISPLNRDKRGQSVSKNYY